MITKSTFTITPTAGHILWCNYDENVSPEMQGRHMVVVISPKAVNKFGTSIVVPISSVVPINIKDWHFKISDNYPFFDKESWIKADLVGHVRNNRFDRIRIQGINQKPKIKFEDLMVIRECVSYAIDHADKDKK